MFIYKDAIGFIGNVGVWSDGMGGYVGGEIASKTAVEAIAYYFKNFSYAAPVQLEKAIQ